jgi:hypothetical protein
MATETGFIQFAEGSAPTTPASTKWRVYFKTDGLYYIDDAGTEIGPLAAAPGGGSGNPLLYDRERYEAGDISITSTTVGADVPSLPDVSVSAAAGDLLMVGVNTRVTDTDSQSMRVDVKIITGATENYVSSLTTTADSLGIAGWFIPGSANGTVTGEVPYVVQAADISGGTVTLSLRAWLSGAGDRPLAAGANSALLFWVRNLGQ